MVPVNRTCQSRRWSDNWPAKTTLETKFRKSSRSDRPPLTLVSGGAIDLLSIINVSMSTLNYSPTSCKPAYQLRWSLSIFPQTLLPPANKWLHDLQASTIRDRVHTLDARLLNNNVIQFLLSTEPSASPPDIVKSVKGRLQTILRPDQGFSFETCG